MVEGPVRKKTDHRLVASAESESAPIPRRFGGIAAAGVYAGSVIELFTRDRGLGVLQKERRKRQR
jgi:hypothetical protein